MGVSSGGRRARRRTRPGAKRYDRAYFDRWYRDPRTSIHHRDALERKVRLALGAAEYLIQGPVRNVLDVGCGEARWQPVLERLRPRVRYLGVDSSPYVAQRFGRRNVRLGSFGRLRELGLEGPFDLIVCSDVLHYVPSRELAPGLAAIAELLGGVAFVEVFTGADAIVGDKRELQPRSPAAYARALRRAGLVHCGLYCFVREDFGPGLTAFERGRG